MDTIAGYRLVRRLARGRRSDVWLGVTRSTDVATTQVAIKLFHPSTPLASIDAEVEALGRASHRHLQQLIDISIDPEGGACLVLERLGVSLARVLAGRSELGTSELGQGGRGLGGFSLAGMSAGEAVTVLAPACLAVAELHRVGVAHGRIDSGSILFDSTGAPVLACFGEARLVGDFPHPPQSSSLTSAQAAAEPDLRADRKQLAALTLGVLEHVKGAESVISWLQHQPSTDANLATELADRLFLMASPTPVALRVVNEETASTLFDVRDALNLPHRAPTFGDEPHTAKAPAEMAEEPGGLLAGIRTALHLPEWLDTIVDEWVRKARNVGLIDRVRSALAPVRKPVWVAAAAGATALIVSAILLGGADQPSTTPAAHTVGEGADGGKPTVSTIDHTPMPAGLADPDPAVAARALLGLRTNCISDLSVLCLDRVNQQGSAAMDADRHLIRQQQATATPGVEPDFSAAEIELIDELGDGALLDVVLAGVPSEGVPPVTASLLLVRTEIGWLIRDLVR